MTGEIIIALALILLLVTFLQPFKLFMPHAMHPFMVPLLVVLLVLLGGVLWKESAGDERDQLHKFISARFAYFAGVVILICGIIIQSFQHSVDPWLISAICVMLLAKIIGHIYGKFKL